MTGRRCDGLHHPHGHRDHRGRPGPPVTPCVVATDSHRGISGHRQPLGDQTPAEEDRPTGHGIPRDAGRPRTAVGRGTGHDDRERHGRSAARRWRPVRWRRRPGARRRAIRACRTRSHCRRDRWSRHARSTGRRRRARTADSTNSAGPAVSIPCRGLPRCGATAAILRPRCRRALRRHPATAAGRRRGASAAPRRSAMAGWVRGRSSRPGGRRC